MNMTLLFDHLMVVVINLTFSLLTDKLNQHVVDQLPTLPGFYDLNHMFESIKAGQASFTKPARIMLARLQLWARYTVPLSFTHVMRCLVYFIYPLSWLFSIMFLQVADWKSAATRIDSGSVEKIRRRATHYVSRQSMLHTKKYPLSQNVQNCQRVVPRKFIWQV